MKNKKTTHNNVELGQLLFGNPVGAYQCTDFVEALISSLFDEIERVYWNINQVEWDRETNPELPGIEFRHYYWGEDEKIARLPNFKFQDIEIRWYKYPFRAATVNVSMTEKQWRQWYDRCMKHIRQQEPIR